MSITKRLILWLTLFVAVLWLAAGLITRFVFVDEISEIYKDQLRTAAHRIMPIVLHVARGAERNGGSLLQLDEDAAFLLTGANGALAFELRDASGKTILMSYDAGDVKFPDTVRPGFAEGDGLQAFTLKDASTGTFLTVVQPDTHRAEAISEATAALFVPMLLLVPIAVFGIWLVIRTATVPIRDLKRRILRAGSGRTDPIEPETDAVELKPIARAVDHAMREMNLALENEVRASADIVHELRTPLAEARMQTQKLAAELGDADGGRTGEILRALNTLEDRMTKVQEIALTGGPLVRPTERANLSRVAHTVIEELKPQSDELGRAIVLENALGQNLMAAFDPDLFAIALRSVLENALRHGTGTDPVTVRIGADWTVSVASQGPKLDPVDRGEFWQGVAIARRAMTQGGGSMRLISPATGRDDGVEAVLILP